MKSADYVLPGILPDLARYCL